MNTPKSGSENCYQITKRQNTYGTDPVCQTDRLTCVQRHFEATTDIIAAQVGGALALGHGEVAGEQISFYVNDAANGTAAPTAMTARARTSSNAGTTAICQSL